MNSKKSLYSLLSCLVFIVLSSVTLWSTDDDIYTDIILINGTAVLADFDYKGEIIKKYSEIPYYFSSYQSHESLVRSSTMKYKGLSISKPHKVFDTDHFLSNESITALDNSSCDYSSTHYSFNTGFHVPVTVGLVPSSAIRQRSFFT